MRRPDKPLTVLVIGSGGREHALCWKLAQSAQVERIYCAPGNGGTATTTKVENVEIQVMDFLKIEQFCRDSKIDFVVVGPDNPLAEGIVDVLHEKCPDLRVFGPERVAATLEWSKAFAKEFMDSHEIPTARFLVCDSYEAGVKIVQENSWARVIKVDGLALGKGVFVCDTQDQALDALLAIFQGNSFGAAGSRVVIEEKLVGEEISLLTLFDGKRLVPLLPSQDHKRRFDRDQGPNTGGMGAYAPIDLFQARRAEIESLVLEPIEKALRDAAFDYNGVLYIGLMITDKPYVLEFNCRFGDPETQAILPLMTSDLLPLLWACTEGALDKVQVTWSSGASCCVIAAAETYPQGSSRGEAIDLGEYASSTSSVKVASSKNKDHVVVFQAGTKLVDGKLLTNGGRVLAVTGIGKDLEAARESAYKAIKKVHFASMAYRKDIAGRALASC
jgi:phosphoribosylamine--glycine ligase